MRHRRPAEPDRAQEGNLEHRPPLFAPGTPVAAQSRIADVVDQDVELAEPLHGAGYDLLELPGVGTVGRQSLRPYAESRGLLRRLVKILTTPRAERNVGPLPS